MQPNNFTQGLIVFIIKDKLKDAKDTIYDY